MPPTDHDNRWAALIFYLQFLAKFASLCHKGNVVFVGIGFGIAASRGIDGQIAAVIKRSQGNVIHTNKGHTIRNMDDC